MQFSKVILLPWGILCANKNFSFFVLFFIHLIFLYFNGLILICRFFFFFLGFLNYLFDFYIKFSFYHREGLHCTFISVHSWPAWYHFVIKAAFSLGDDILFRSTGNGCSRIYCMPASIWQPFTASSIFIETQSPYHPPDMFIPGHSVVLERGRGRDL